MGLLSQVYKEGIALGDRAGLLCSGSYSRTVLYTIAFYTQGSRLIVEKVLVSER